MSGVGTKIFHPRPSWQVDPGWWTLRSEKRVGFLEVAFLSTTAQFSAILIRQLLLKIVSFHAISVLYGHIMMLR